MTYFDRRLASWLLSTSGAALLAGTQAIANPLGGTVVTGDVQISGTGTTSVIIDNNSARSIVDWDEFSIGTGETTRINQATSSSAIMNRVTGGNMSEIYGSLDSNGIVYLINENGIVVGPTGEISTGGFVASTLDTTNQEFLAGGDMIFRQGIETGGGITVYGKIRSVTGGDIFLLSREIDIEAGADISSNGGYVGLGAGEEILLKPVDSGDGRITIRVGKGRIKNAGRIAGAVTELKAAGGNEYALAINNTGVIRATGVSKRGGRVMLTAGGKISNSGKIRATKKVRIKSRKKIRNTGKIRVTGVRTKTVYVKPQIVFEAPEVEIAAGSLLDVSAALGGGSVFIGGGYQGGNTDNNGGTVDIAENAQNVIVESGAVIKADAIGTGDGGTVVVWSDDTTTFNGSVSARAGADAGDGGFIEISGKEHLIFDGDVNASSEHGAAGTVLFDPGTITVTAGGVGTGPDTFSDSGIQTTLAGGTNVTLKTSLATAGAQDVNFDAGVRIVWTEDSLFRVEAGNDINALDDVIIQNTEVGDGTNTTVTGNGGVVFRAGNDINIGSATTRTNGVAIGSEFGFNSFTAGVLNPAANGAPDKAGDINVISGDVPFSYAHVGYQQDTLRGAGTGNDFSAAGVRAENGDVTLSAGKDVNITGSSSEVNSFAQVGHGGYRRFTQGISGALIQTTAETVGRIFVTAGMFESGDVTLAGSVTGGVGQSGYAQIGHGSNLNSHYNGAGKLTQGDISGQVAVSARNGGDVLLNTSVVSTATTYHQMVRSQIGHGGFILYDGVDISGDEAVQGRIQGYIRVETSNTSGDAGAVNLGTSVSAAATDDLYRIDSQIGHGGHTKILYNGSVVALGDGSLDAVHGTIGAFEALGGTNTGLQAFSVGTSDIEIRSGEVNLIAQEATENSAKAGPQLVDNLQRSQVGHGSHTESSINTRGGAGTIVSVVGSTNITGISTVAVNVDVNGISLDAFLARTQQTPGSVGYIDLSGKTVGTADDLTGAQRDDLQAFITANSITSAAAPGIDYTTNNAQLDISVTENLIMGDIDVIDREQGATGGITLSSTITGTLTATNRDAMITRIGHASVSHLDSHDGKTAGGDGWNGGDVTVRQAHITGANIKVQTQGVEGDDQDISLITNVTAGLAVVQDNTTVAQIGHSGDIFATTGDGGDSSNGDFNAGDGGDITIYKGTVWDGGLEADDATVTGDSFLVNNGTNITVNSSNEIIITADTAAALASADRNNSESQIGHGHKIRVHTGDGGDGAADGRNGGAGGDILIVQGVDVREYGLDNTGFDEFATGIRGDIILSATNTSGIAINMASTDTSALAASTWNSNYSLAGHSDIIELTSGDGGDAGGAGTGGGGQFNTDGDSEDFDNVVLNNDVSDDEKGQVEAHGGRGGHIDVQLGRLTVDQGGDTVTTDSLSLNTRTIGLNGGDKGDFRARNLSGNANMQDHKLQGVMLIESDIFVSALGQVKLASTVNNALSPATNEIVETFIGHGSRIFADSGDGGDGGNENFYANNEPVFVSEQEGENFLNYDSGQGSNRGGNGGDIRLTFGDITDRETRDVGGDTIITHESDADSTNNSSITLSISDGTNTVTLPDSLLITSTVNAGLSEGTGSDVQAMVGHHVRMFGEGGIGGDGGSSNTEFDADGNSLFTNDALVPLGSALPSGYVAGPTVTIQSVDYTYVEHDGTIAGSVAGTRINLNQLDVLDGGTGLLSDSVDETALQAGAVYIQPNSSGGRGGDVLIVNNQIHGDIVVQADRRVTVATLAGHGEFTKVFSTIGHSTHLVSVTQNGGDAGVLYEPADTDATFDGGIINVNGTQTGENDEANAFAHVLIDGNQDDEFNLTGNGDADSTSGEDGIAVTTDDIANRTGSTFKSISDQFNSAAGSLSGELVATTSRTDVIFHDEEADPQYIIDDLGTTSSADDVYVLNTEGANQLHAHSATNLARFGRVVSTYDGQHNPTTNETGLFDATASVGSVTGDLSLQVFVDMDRDGDVDLVDFDRDGRLDIVDVDRDGYMDTIDGRANYVKSSIHTGDADPNGITGIGVLDYVAVTGEGFDSGHLQGGWSTENELRTVNLLGQYNLTGGSDFTSAVSDFSTANGGRGGDAYTQTGFSSGDISVATGDPDDGSADSLILSVNLIDDVVSVGGNDYHKATIGHSAWQISDTSAEYAPYRAGREGLEVETDTHVSADGGDANFYAVNGHGGRGGNAEVLQGVNRDHSVYDGNGNLVNNEKDHLVGKIFINTPNDLDTSVSNDAKRITLNSFVDTDYGDNTAIVQIGHSSEVAAMAANLAGVGASDPKEEDDSSQTEIADGGDGGDATVVQNHIKGLINVMTGADDSDGSKDFSLVINAENGAATVPGGPDNLIISEIGHGRRAQAFGGMGGNGDDGQLSGNGGDGGYAKIDQTEILDATINVDLVEFDPSTGTADTLGYFGNGAKITASVFENGGNTVRAQVGHGDLAQAVGGDAGDGSPEWNVNEQRNQTANGGLGGDAIVNQAGYNYDITMDIGYNITGPYALDIVASAANANTAKENHILANVGHGGLGFAVSGNGGDGGLSGSNNGIQSRFDPNLVDSDYNYGGSQVNGDTPYAIDKTNSFFLGTERAGGHAGIAIVNQNVGGTGRILSGRMVDNDYGVDDINGAGIDIDVFDRFDAGIMASAGHDGIRVRGVAGPGTNQTGPIYQTTGLVGHHGFGETNGGVGGDGIQTSLSAIISIGDGGDGGSAITTMGAIWGDIDISNVGNPAPAGNLDNSPDDKATNIVIESAGGTGSDSVDHRAEARVGHLTHVEATSGAGGDASKEAGSVPAFPATISAQGGDGGDALTFQGQHTGNITLTAENTVRVVAYDDNAAGVVAVSGVGHRHEARAIAAIGGFGGTSNVDKNENEYFTYEALREFHYRRTAGASDTVAFAALSTFEQSLVAPVTDYFENKPGELEIFLDRLIGDNINVIAANERDNDFVGNTNFTIPAITGISGTDHVPGSADGEIETLFAILAASGHGGNASITQGSVGLDGVTTDELAASGNITLEAKAYDLTDADRGVEILADSNATGSGMQLAHVGHQSEVYRTLAGKGQNLIGANANANGIGGDGGDAIVDQYAHNGGIQLLSDHEILVRAQDIASGAQETRAWVGHRLTIGPDFTGYRKDPIVRSGDGGSETNDTHDDGRIGNGGDVFISQRGVISGTQRTVNSFTDIRYNTEIQLIATNDSENDTSIIIDAIATGSGAPDVETHIGHDFEIASVKAGDAGRHASNSDAQGAEGLLEANGGDIFIAQTDLGADIDIAGRDAVQIKADSSTTGTNWAHLMIGHERTIGVSSNTDDPRTGTIVAGWGGDAYIEDVNVTSTGSISSAANGYLEDADAGRIDITLGKLTDSFEEGDDNTRLVTITSITENVEINSIAANGATSYLEIGNQQHVIATTLEASHFVAIGYTQTAGDGGDISIARDTINGDILIQTLDADRTTRGATGNVTGGAANPTVGRQVQITTVSGDSATAENQIGHETTFIVSTAGMPGISGQGEDVNYLFTTNLPAFVGLATAGSNTSGEATLKDAENAVKDMLNLVRALKLAMTNADRYPADDGNNSDLNDQGDLTRLLADAEAAYSTARAALNNIGDGTNGSVIETAAVNTVQTQATAMITAATDFQTVVASIPEGTEQIADHADSGDIRYTGVSSDNFDIDAVRTVKGTSQAGALVMEGYGASDTGIVTGDVTVRAGHYAGSNSINNVANDDSIIATLFTGSGAANTDDLDDNVVVITATSDSLALTEVGHRRFMTNETERGGGEHDGGSDDGGIAGDGGSIETKNTTSGDIDIRAEEVVIRVDGAAGDGEVHLLHSSYTMNSADHSDLEALLGSGGDITNTTSVSGGVNISAERIASDVDAQDRSFLATGLANTFMHFGHQVNDTNTSDSDPTIGGNGDAQTNLGSNRGGKIVSTQTVGGNINNDLVTINLDVNGDGGASDLIFQTLSLGHSDIRLGNGDKEYGMLPASVFHSGVSGNATDDGDTVNLIQTVGGNIVLSQIEDLELRAEGAGNNDIWFGHDAEQFGQSGQVNSADVVQYGERVTVTQTVTGNIDITPTSTFHALLGGATSGELHVGHEATQTAFSADDSADPSDFEDIDNNDVADGNVASAPGVNDDFDQPDILATQLVQARISIVTGEITLQNDSAQRLQFGHEAFHIASVDGDLGEDVLPRSTGHVVAISQINPGTMNNDDDIIFTATGATGQSDSIVDHMALNGANGDIQLINTAVGELQVGHRSTSTMSDGTPVAEGTYNTLQSIGDADDVNGDGEIDDTSQSVIKFTAAQDIVIDNQAAGTTQVGHYITEASDLQVSPVFVDGTTGTGLAAGDSLLRQIVGSDIIFGDNTNQGSGGTGAEGAGNNLVLASGAGRGMIGHMSPETNTWQVEGTRRVTVQLLDGDITVEGGTDTDTDAPNGTVLNAAATLADESGSGDDILIDGTGGGVARIGHNQANAAGGGNLTQASAGDIWVRAGGDLHVLGGAIGHEDYDFASSAVSDNSALPGSAIRDRIRGNTTIGAGQNSAAHDSTLIADLMVFDGSTNPVLVNSGYGGKADADVDGELRFFLPAQEGLTIVTPVTFNDSASNMDDTSDRTAEASNVFEGNGGTDHEHDFTNMATTADYLDDIIGDGNFGFYFEGVSGGPEFLQFEPNIETLNFNSGFSVTFNDQQSGGTVNTRILDGNTIVGTSSFDVECEENGLSPEECENPGEGFTGQQRSAGSSVGHSGTGGGNSTGLGDSLEDELNEFNQVGLSNSAGYVQQFNLRAPVTSFIEQPIYGSNQKVKYARTNVPTVVTSYAPVTTVNHADRVEAIAVDNTYGQYMTGADLAEWRIKQRYGDVMAQQTSYRLFERRG